ncbi:MAG TPA: hypothetical protein GX011_00375 [Clostridiales bacterium]|jgi:penicillin-binding protein 2|nr:hypothetical protein [Clostridiales bacterium]
MNRTAKRITAVVAVFCLACFVFTARLVSLQLINRNSYAPAQNATYTRESIIVAERGSICDRYGRVLVCNEYSYNLEIDYYSLPDTLKEENEAFLALARAVREAGHEVLLSPDYPLAGSYPDMSYVPGEAAGAVRDRIIARYRRKSNITAPGLAEYLAGRYDLLDKNGNLVCTPEEALLVMQLRWSLIEQGFSETGSYTLAENIGLDLMSVVSERQIPGGIVRRTSRRSYTYPGYASHILGQLGKIYAEDWPYYRERGYPMDALVGISGCEKLFEEYLRGVDGVMVTEYDKDGYIINKYIKTPPTPGRDVWLTIDIDLQIAAEDGLCANIDYVKEHSTGNLTGEDAAAGAFCMVEVDTGQVLAIASYPTYDLTTYNKDYEKLASAEVSPLLNRAINGLYAPGSIYKIGVAAAALTEGIISPDTIINTTGKYTYFPDYQPRCWIYVSTGGSHGPINVSEAIRVSCNYFFYELGRRLGIDRLNKYSSLCGLGQPTSFELGGATGILAGPAYRNLNGLAAWKETDTIVAAIGQSENLFSPLQINMYIAAIANGGTRYAATLFYGVADFGSDQSIIPPPPSVLSSFELSGSTRRTLLQAMESVVSSSWTISDMFRRVPVPVAGKTGTAQVGETKSENALFVALAPAADPKVAAVCVIEQGHAGSYAAYTPGRVFEVYFNK